MGIQSFGSSGILRDAGGQTADIEANGGLAVNIQDQHTTPFDLYFTQALGIPTTLSSGASIGDTTVSLTALPAGTAIGDLIGIFSGVSGEERFYFGEILDIDTLDIDLDTPLDFAFQSGDPVIAQDREMNVTGTIATPEIFSVTAGTTESGLVLDITRIMFQMTLTTAGDDGKFGNIAGVSVVNGLVLRRVDGDTRNIFNIKSNGELAGLCYDLTYTNRSGGGGDFGLRARYTFAGQDKHGVTIRLNPGDSLQAIVQDDLTTGASITQFRMIAAGHVVSDL